ALAACRLSLKHSRQKIGRPCVGRKGTVVSFPHCEHTAWVSTLGLGWNPWRTGVTPIAASRLLLQFLHRFGSFLNCLSWKNNCSPAVKTNSLPQSTQIMVLSWNSIRELLWPSATGAQARKAHALLRNCPLSLTADPGFGPPHGEVCGIM